VSQTFTGGSREIPDLPAGDYRFLAIVAIDGHGRPRQLEMEYRKALTDMLENRFGRHAKLTSLTKAAHEIQITDDDEH
jgi:hypothetical protein